MVARLTRAARACGPTPSTRCTACSTSRESSQLYDLDRPDLKYEPWVPHTQRRLAKRRGRRPLRRDRARATSSSSTRTTRSRRASRRSSARPPRIPRVATLKTTVYRTSHDSALAPALIEAAENGKQSVCVVELKARFDEQRNIEWARSLEQAGVHVVYGFPDMKIHAKTTLVIRTRGRRLRRYVHIGTGNYHATTARDLRGRRALHRRSRDLGRHRRPLQLHHRLRPAAARSARSSSRRSTCAASWSSASARSRRPRRRGEHARIRIKVNNIADPRDRRGALPGLPGGRRDRPDRPRRLRAAPGRRGPERADPRPLRSSAASSSTAGSTASRPARRRATSSAAPT